MNKTFLICHRGALGDFILTWPSVFSLRKNFPSHSFTGIGRPEYMRLAKKLGIVDSFFGMESSEMSDFFEGRKIPSGIGRPDAAALWMKDGFKPAELIRREASLPATVIEPFPGSKIHVAKYHCLKISEGFGTGIPENPADCLPEFSPGDGNIVHIHPGSGSDSKNYSFGFYRKIADNAGIFLKKEVRFILGPVEIEKGADRHFPSESTDRPENVEALADLLAGSYLYVGNDSGATHLSGVLGVQTIALYRNTDPEAWGAFGRKTSCLKDPDEDSLLKKINKYFLFMEQFLALRVKL